MPSVTSVRPEAVAIYIRWSTDEQSEGTTLQTQQERCSLYVRSQGWAVNEALLFIDDGHSGGSLDRPALTRLRQAVQAGRVDCVVTYSMDRLSRSVADTVQLVQEEWAGKCIYRSASQPISTEDDNPTGQLIFNILASFAEFERALIRERTHSGLVRRARQGMYPSTRVPPYGYRRDGKGRLIIDPGAAEVVRQIFALAAGGQGPTLIARQLAKARTPAPGGGGVWWAHQVRSLLQNPVYCGDLVYGRRRVNPAHRRNKGAPRRLAGAKPLAVVADAVPAIVDRTDWERAQQLFADRAAAKARQSLQAANRSLLSAIARCRCGGPLSLFYDSRKRRYYRCSRNFLSAGGCGHAPGVLPAESIEAAIGDAIRERYGTPELHAAAMAEAARIKTTNDGRTRAEVERQLKQVTAELDRLRRAARRGEITLSTFEELKGDAEAERQELLARRTTLSTADTEPAAPVDLWDDLDVTSQREIIAGLLRSVVIYRAKGSGAAPEVNFLWEMKPGQ